MKFDLRFWEETLPPGDVVKKGLPLLEQYGAGVAVVLYPVSLTRKNANAMRKLKDAGVELTFWPLMEKELGYFPGEQNTSPYAAMVRHLLEWAASNEVTPDVLAVDLEMPISQMTSVLGAPNRLAMVRRALASVRQNLDRERYYRAKACLDELNKDIQDMGIRTLTAVLPWVALEMEGDGELMQDMSETPASGIGWDLVSPMLYASMLTGMTGNAITPRDANWLIYDSCRHLREKYGGRAAVSIGLTGRGVLEDEPVFDEPRDLVAGLEAALAAGVRDVSVYSLEGVLSRPDPRAWMEALRGAEPRIPERSRKVADVLAAARVVYPPVARLVDWYRRG